MVVVWTCCYGGLASGPLPPSLLRVDSKNTKRRDPTRQIEGLCDLLLFLFFNYSYLFFLLTAQICLLTQTHQETRKEERSEKERWEEDDR